MVPDHHPTLQVESASASVICHGPASQCRRPWPRSCRRFCCAAGCNTVGRRGRPVILPLMLRAGLARLANALLTSFRPSCCGSRHVRSRPTPRSCRIACMTCLRAGQYKRKSLVVYRGKLYSADVMKMPDTIRYTTGFPRFMLPNFSQHAGGRGDAYVTGEPVAAARLAQTRMERAGENMENKRRGQYGPSAAANTVRSFRSAWFGRPTQPAKPALLLRLLFQAAA